MSDLDNPRMVLVVPPWEELRAAYGRRNLVGVEELLKGRITQRLGAGLDASAAQRFDVVALPSNDTGEERRNRTTMPEADLLVFALVMTGGQRSVEALAKVVEAVYGRDASFGADLLAGPASDTHWCPDEAEYPLFGDRIGALQMMRADVLPASLPGARAVNLVMMDTGIPAGMLPQPPEFRGWNVAVAPGVVRQPGDPLTGHGEMVARNASALAPNARLLDCPMIPDGVTNLTVFLSSVIAAVIAVRGTIQSARNQEPAGDRSAWVLCNAWGVFDPSSEPPGSGRYSDNPNHPLAKEYRKLLQLDADIVFAAGNCGQFCPNPACGPAFTGPGASINGANALPEVLTVGAMRLDRLWLGYSGQGPGIANMAPEKPDLCAPSQFENEDDAGANTGTSAACGLVAGAVALLRTEWGPSAVSPAALQAVLRHGAVQPDGSSGWQGRTGYGVLDLAAVADTLNAP